MLPPQRLVEALTLRDERTFDTTALHSNGACGGPVIALQRQACFSSHERSGSPDLPDFTLSVSRAMVAFTGPLYLTLVINRYHTDVPLPLSTLLLHGFTPVSRGSRYLTGYRSIFGSGLDLYGSFLAA